MAGFIDLCRRQGTNMAEQIRAKSELWNPALMENMVGQLGIDARGTNLPPSLFHPANPRSEDFFDALES